MLAIDNLIVQVGRRTILDGIDLVAQPGEITAIIGPNGSGKSTLLKAIAGELPHRGDIRLNGRSLRSIKSTEIAAERAVLPQQSALSFPFTVHEIVAMGARAGGNGLSPDDLQTLPARALAQVDLTGFGGRLYQDISGGEQQRVQLARVLCQVWRPLHAGIPRWLLLDEPVSSLDIRHQLLVMEIARDFAAAGGGVVAILHDLNLAALHADRIIALADGRILANGQPSSVLTVEMIERVFGCALNPVPLRQGLHVFAPERAA